MPVIDTENPTVTQTMVFPEMLQAYEAHLNKEFSSENMSFLRALHDLQGMASDPNVSDTTLKQQAAGIYDHYVKTDSARTVNLPSASVNHMHAHMENLATLNRQQTLDMFQETQHDVTALISRDSFRRFVASPEFKAAAEKVDSNLAVETQIENLRDQAEQARLHPTVGDRMKSSVGGKTKAQELTEQADALQVGLDKSRELAPLDVPQVTTQNVINDATVAAGKQRAFEARQEEARQEEVRRKEMEIPPPPPELDNDIPPPPPELDQEQDVAPPSQELDQDIPPPPELDEDIEQDAPEVGEASLDGAGDWPELEEQDVVQRQELEPQMEVAEMSMEELGEIELGEGRSRGQQVDGIEIGKSRGRGQGLDGSEQTQTRGLAAGNAEPPAPSVRDSMGHRDDKPKQGQGGPKAR
ncbi:MAG: hypothetical protein ACAH88_02205 [Roseimicrobium sp.]